MVWGVEGQNREKVLFGKVIKGERSVRFDSARFAELVVFGVKVYDPVNAKVESMLV